MGIIEGITILAEPVGKQPLITAISLTDYRLFMVTAGTLILLLACIGIMGGSKVGKICIGIIVVLGVASTAIFGYKLYSDKRNEKALENNNAYASEYYLATFDETADMNQIEQNYEIIASKNQPGAYWIKQKNALQSTAQMPNASKSDTITTDSGNTYTVFPAS